MLVYCRSRPGSVNRARSFGHNPRQVMLDLRQLARHLELPCSTLCWIRETFGGLGLEEKTSSNAKAQECMQVSCSVLVCMGSWVRHAPDMTRFRCPLHYIAMPCVTVSVAVHLGYVALQTSQINVCMFVFLSVCLSVCLYVCLLGMYVFM